MSGKRCQLGAPIGQLQSFEEHAKICLGRTFEPISRFLPHLDSGWLSGGSTTGLCTAVSALRRLGYY